MMENCTRELNFFACGRDLIRLACGGPPSPEGKANG